MPSQTFFNLDSSKRERLINAIKIELSRVPFDEVSINRIIKTADIPRGSFYQYFANKEDMLFFILSDYQEEMVKRIEENLIASDGDIFNMFIEMLDYTIEFGTSKDTYAFCKNLFSDIKVAINLHKKLPKCEVQNEILNLFKRYINSENLNINTEEDLDNIISILLTITREASVMIFMNISQAKEIREQYLRKIELVKFGLLKH